MIGHLVSSQRILTAGFFLLVTPFAFAQDSREERRFRRLLEGRNDFARLKAIESVAGDFKARSAALPAVVASMDELLADGRFDRINDAQPELSDGIASMIRFIATVEKPEATESLVRVLSSQRKTWVMLSASVLAKHHHHDAIDDILALREHGSFATHYGFRFSVARALTEMSHPDAWEALAKLSTELDGQLWHLIQERFDEVTLDDFEGESERFESWQESAGVVTEEAEKTLGDEPKSEDQPDTDPTLPKQMVLAPSMSPAAYRQRRLAPSKYYGIDIHAKRMLFVIDRSGSMNTLEGYDTRMAKAKRELTNAISGLTEDSEFGILVFDTQIRSWKSLLVAATDKNKRDAAQFISKLSAGSSTNTYGALRLSLEFDDQLEAVFFLSDGKPTTGRVLDPAVILTDVLRRNEVKHIMINTIAITRDPILQNFLRNLAEPSQGEFRAVTR
ncbi:MAG: VWA domain-containing protein [Planctomycetota bacterium]